mgnify:CR=1 FL=1
MPRFTPTFTETETTDWQAGDLLRSNKFAEQIGQNLEFLLQDHDHNGHDGDGGTIQAVTVSQLWFYGVSAGS